MKLMVLVPKVVRNYIAQFPEVRHNAYKYFNYDNRIVSEKVERFDDKIPYQGPDDLTNSDYNRLVTYAKTLINPVLAKYSNRIANEDALNIAIRSFNKGQFDGKVNAGRFDILIKAMEQPIMQPPLLAKKQTKEKPKKDIVVKPHVLKQLGIKRKDVPLKQRVRHRQEGVPYLIQEKGRVVKK